MSSARLARSFGVEFWHTFRRPLFIALLVILVLNALRDSERQAADQLRATARSAARKAWITSEFAQTQMMTYLVLLYYAFFIAGRRPGMSLLRDREAQGRRHAARHAAHAGRVRVGPLPRDHARLRRAHGARRSRSTPSSTTSCRTRRPPRSAGRSTLANYLMPVLHDRPAVPGVLRRGVSMYIGEKTRSAVLVFLLPIATLLDLRVLPVDLVAVVARPRRVNRVLQVIEPSGYRWLNETHLKVDQGRGVLQHSTPSPTTRCSGSTGRRRSRVSARSPWRSRSARSRRRCAAVAAPRSRARAKRDAAAVAEVPAAAPERPRSRASGDEERRCRASSRTVCDRGARRVARAADASPASTCSCR